jgi:hypoxanthine phosphoribosyltransferase
MKKPLTFQAELLKKGDRIQVTETGFSWEFEIPSWEGMYESLLELARKIRKAGFKPDIVVGVARGGWPVARVMSDLLENPEVANVKAEFYLGVAETKKKPIITQPVSASVESKKVLVVDDVADTGKSLALVKEHLKGQGAAVIRIATIYYKPWSVLKPDWFERQTERWIVFPWERKETIKRILEKCRKEGVSIEQAKEALVRYGLDRRLAERFIQEIAEGKP